MLKIAVIPARYGSKRFPGKPLANILDKPMIQWVYENVSKVKDLDDVYVATDDERIIQCVKHFQGNVLMTSNKHTCGSDRINECREILKLDNEDIILNVQGDEPLIQPEMIEELLAIFEDSEVYMATLKKQMKEEEDFENPNIVKVVTDNYNNALMFSRYALPYNRDGQKCMVYYKHIGIYGYKAGFLKHYSTMEKSYLEQMESLEQLRVLEHGFKIRVEETQYQTIGVDTPEQLKEIEQRLKKELLHE